MISLVLLIALFLVGFSGLQTLLTVSFFLFLFSLDLVPTLVACFRLLSLIFTPTITVDPTEALCNSRSVPELMLSSAAESWTLSAELQLLQGLVYATKYRKWLRIDDSQCLLLLTVLSYQCEDVCPRPMKGQKCFASKLLMRDGAQRPPPMPFHHYSHLSNALLSAQGKKTLPDESLGRDGHVRKYIGCFCCPAFLFPYFLLPTIPQADCSYLPTFHFNSCLSLIGKGYLLHIWRTLWSEPSRCAHGYSEVRKAVSCIVCV